MTDVYLALGSNLGDRAAHLTRGLNRLEEVGEIAALSGVYETEPVGYADQPAFLNMVALLRTDLEPVELMDRIHVIERAAGRERTFRNAPRTLDVDILLYGDRWIAEEGLTVPHPRMTQRPFVLVPLLELAPELREPRTGRPFSAYLDVLDPPDGGRRGGDRVGGVRRIMNGEELLDGDDG